MAKTKRDYFNELLEVVSGNEALTAFINHELELLDKKNSAPKAPTKKQLENRDYKDQIVANLGDAKMTISEMTKAWFDGVLSTQRVSALVKQLVDDGILVRTVEARKAYFSVA